MDKRCFSVQEAQEYLGLKRRTFSSHIAPRLNGKGIKVGVSVLYERSDLDIAWNDFKMSLGEERPKETGGIKWDAQKYRESTRQRTVAVGKSIPATKGKAFADAVSRLHPKLKPI